MKKPGIPSLPKTGESRTRFDGAVAGSLEIIMGRRRSTVALIPNPDTVTAPEIAAKINEILELLQG